MIPGGSRPERPPAARWWARFTAYSVLRKGVEIPYALAYVNLPEGVSMLSNIVDCDFDALKIGQKVALCFKPSAKGTQIPMFKPA